VDVKSLFSQIDLSPWRNNNRTCQNRYTEKYQNEHEPHQTRIHTAGFGAGRYELSGQEKSSRMLIFS
jgi:hypothetical protein